MYREILLDEYKNPKNKFKMINPDCEHCEYNTTCGDKLTVYIKFEEKNLDDDVNIVDDHTDNINDINDDDNDDSNINYKIIKDISFDGCGCLISQVSASLFTEYAKGKKVSEIKNLDEKKIIELLGVKINPVRMKCAMLILKTTINAINDVK